LAYRRSGKLPWKAVLQPAIQLAQDGLVLDANLASSLNSFVNSAADFPEAQRVFGKPRSGEADSPSWAEGDRLVQKDLAATLRLIAEDGPDAFYKGAIADKIVAEMKAGGGLVTKADLAAYRANARGAIPRPYPR